MKKKESVQKIAFTVEEFCTSVGIGRTKFYEEIKAGRIQAKKAGRKTLVPIAEAVAYVDRLPDLVRK